MQIFQNFLTDDEQKIVQTALSSSAWKFGFVSNDKTKPIWNYDINVARPAVLTLMSKLDDYEFVDCHINGQTLGQTTAVHNDVLDGSCSHALVYFPYDWRYNWGGRLHIFTKEEANVVTPQRNLAVLFDADLLHYAEGPTENILRISIGLKLKKVR